MATSLGTFLFCGLRVVFHALRFTLYFIATCKYFHATCGVRISKVLHPGRVNLGIGGDIIDNPIRGLPRVLGYAINLTKLRHFGSDIVGVCCHA